MLGLSQGQRSVGSLQVAGVRFHLERVLNAAEVESLERALLEQGVQGGGRPFSSTLAPLDDASLPYIDHVRRVIAELTHTSVSHQEPWRAQRIVAPQVHAQPQTTSSLEAVEGMSLSERVRGGARTHTAVLYLGTGASADATEFPLLDLTVRPTPGMLLIWTLERTFTARPRALQGVGATRWELVTWVRDLPCNEDPGEVPTRELARPK